MEGGGAAHMDGAVVLYSILGREVVWGLLICPEQGGIGAFLDEIEIGTAPSMFDVLNPHHVVQSVRLRRPYSGRRRVGSSR